MSAIKCNNCNIYNNDKASYCRNCGKPLAPCPTPTPTPTPTTSSNGDIIVQIILTIIVIGIAIGLGVASIGIATPILVWGCYKCLKEIWEW